MLCRILLEGGYLNLPGVKDIALICWSVAVLRGRKWLEINSMAIVGSKGQGTPGRIMRTCLGLNVPLPLPELFVFAVLNSPFHLPRDTVLFFGEKRPRDLLPLTGRRKKDEDYIPCQLEVALALSKGKASVHLYMTKRNDSHIFIPLVRKGLFEAG